MKRIVLFRFHHQFDICRNHLQIIRMFNPGADIYGLYGGLGKNLSQAKRVPVQHVWEIPFDDAYWKWVNGDLCIRWWFKEFGKSLKFDMLHVFEWDMVLLEAVETQFGHVKTGIALSGIKRVSEILETSYWVGPLRGRGEWGQLLAFARNTFNYRSDPVVGIFGGACLSREFLERYAATEVQSWCNDEIRTALFAQAFNMSIADTNLRSSHFDSNYSECISADAVYEKYLSGVTAFHPVREALDTRKIRGMMKKRCCTGPV
jgi:hypothetical protein